MYWTRLVLLTAILATGCQDKESANQDTQGPANPKLNAHPTRGGIATYDRGQHLRSAIQRQNGQSAPSVLSLNLLRLTANP